MTTRVEVVPEPRAHVYTLQLWARNWRNETIVVAARLFTASGLMGTPQHGAEILLEKHPERGTPKRIGPMTWHRGWRVFHRFLPESVPERDRIFAIAKVNGFEVAWEELMPAPAPQTVGG